MSVEDLLRWKNEGLTLKEISDQTGINHDTLRSRYVAANVDFHRAATQPAWDLSRICNQCDADGQYVIGLLAADGYIDNNRSVCISIQERDVELLHRVSNVLGRPNCRITGRVTQCGSAQVTLCIGSKELVNFLVRDYGFSPRKSRTLPFPHHLGNPLPYLRGFFDGDGCMWNYCTFTVGSHEFATGLMNWVGSTYGYTPNVQMVGVNKDIFNIGYCKRHGSFIRDLFSYPGLARKTEAFLRYLPN